MKKQLLSTLIYSTTLLGMTAALQASPLVWWRFEDNSSGKLVNSGSASNSMDVDMVSGSAIVNTVPGGTINDQDGSYTNVGSYHNGATSGGIGSQLSQSASTQMSSILRGEFTLEVFVYLTDGESAFSTIFGGSAGGTSFVLSATAGAGSGMYIEAKAVNGTTSLIGGPKLTANQWHHIALVGKPNVEGSGVALALYVDYEHYITDFFSGGLDISDEILYRIGGPNSFPGYIDELRVSNTALSPDQFATAAAIPEPAGVALLISGCALFAGLRGGKSGAH